MPPLDGKHKKWFTIWNNDPSGIIQKGKQKGSLEKISKLTILQCVCLSYRRHFWDREEANGSWPLMKWGRRPCYLTSGTVGVGAGDECHFPPPPGGGLGSISIPSSGTVGKTLRSVLNIFLKSGFKLNFMCETDLVFMHCLCMLM